MANFYTQLFDEKRISDIKDKQNNDRISNVFNNIYDDEKLNMNNSDDYNRRMAKFMYSLQEILSEREYDRYGDIMNFDKERDVSDDPYIRLEYLKSVFGKNIELLSSYSLLFVALKEVFNVCLKYENCRDFLDIDEFFEYIWGEFFAGEKKIYDVNSVAYLGKNIPSENLLHMICRFDDLNLIKKTIHYGAFTDVKNSYGVLPLNLSKNNKDYLLSKTDTAGIDGLNFEILLRNHENVRIEDIYTLLKNHKQVSSIITPNTDNPLHLIFKYMNIKSKYIEMIVDLLVKNGVSVNDFNKQGFLPINMFLDRFFDFSKTREFSYLLFPTDKSIYKNTDLFSKMEEQVMRMISDLKELENEVYNDDIESLNTILRKIIDNASSSYMNDEFRRTETDGDSYLSLNNSNHYFFNK